MIVIIDTLVLGGLRTGIRNDKGRFYEKVINVEADVAALLIFLVLYGFRHISAENFALGSLRSDDWQLGRPTAPPLLSVFRVFSPPNASSLPCCIDPPVTSQSSWERSETQFS